MEDPKKREATWPAVYFIRNDLKQEKMNLVQDMTDLSLHYWGGTDAVTDAYMKEISDRIETINRVLYNIETANYKVEDE